MLEKIQLLIINLLFEMLSLFARGKKCLLILNKKRGEQKSKQQFNLIIMHVRDVKFSCILLRSVNFK